jgi:large subunit ribosomal protein L27
MLRFACTPLSNLSARAVTACHGAPLPMHLQIAGVGARGMATSASGGSTKNTSGNAGRRLGMKVTHMQPVVTNQILIRQRGTKWHAGINVLTGRDHTLHAKSEGVVHVCRFFDPYRKGKLRYRKFLNVLPPGEALPDSKLMQTAFLEERVKHTRHKLNKRDGVPSSKFMVPKAQIVEYMVRMAEIKMLQQRGIIKQ